MRLPSMRGEIHPLAYALLAPLLVLSQHGLTAWLYRLKGERLEADLEFWLLPLGEVGALFELNPVEAGLAFTFGLIVAWAVALISFRRACRARRGHLLAAASVIPVIQIPAIAVLAVMPAAADAEGAEPSVSPHIEHMVQGLLAGVAIIVFAVLLSAVAFGAYGWGLFVLTPFTVGLTTGYVVNRDEDLGLRQTVGLVMAAAGLGSVALIMFALEGLACLVLISPLAAFVAFIGALLGHNLALARHHRDKPLLAVALLPAVFVLEAAMPPSADIRTAESIEIDAPATAVWDAVTSDRPISSPPGLVGRAGLAYPIRGRLLGEGVGALRLGEFSTGTALERVTIWETGRRLGFEVIAQPPAMEEMSPYRRVHAPHVSGYFNTAETRFELEPLAGGGTRLTVRASHVLRIDPIPYWEPIARWATRQNSRRVLLFIKQEAETTATRSG